MTDPLVASTRYGDLKGGASADFWTFPPKSTKLLDLGKRCGVPAGYTSVAVEINWMPPLSGELLKHGEEELQVKVTVFAMDSSLLPPGSGPLERYADEVDQVVVFPFGATMPVAEVLGLFKQLCIVLINRQLERTGVVVTQTNS